MEPLNRDKHVSHSGCGHMMHVVCLAKWFGQNPSCPHCRRGQEIGRSFVGCELCEMIGQPLVSNNDWVVAKCCDKRLHRFCFQRHMDCAAPEERLCYDCNAEWTAETIL